MLKRNLRIIKKEANKAGREFNWLVLGLSFFLLLLDSSDANAMKRVIFTDIGPPSSFDPLMADAWSHIPVARMLYATPVEMLPDGTLGSSVLEKFDYDPQKSTLVFKVKTNQKFQDDTVITPDDVLLSILRFAATHPKFPVIQEIEGLHQWLEGHPQRKPKLLAELPSGITRHGQTISIKFSAPVQHPLFRFSLEIFSIIPSRCVDLNNYSITCQMPPGSGPYQLKINKKEKLIFSRVRLPVGVREAPEEIHFLYEKPETLETWLQTGKHSKDTVISGNETFFAPELLQKFIKNGNFRFFQDSSFGVFLLNPKVKPFNETACRQEFVRLFHQSFNELFSHQLTYESSVFQKLLPGYVSTEDLFKERGRKNHAVCTDKIAKNPLTWATAGANRPEILIRTITHLYKKLGVTIEAPQVVENRAKQSELFVSGKIALFDGYTGFWALDPAGDMRMLFAPGFHPTLQYVANDRELQGLLNKLKQKESDENFRRVNYRLFDQSHFNVYMHIRKFFAAPKSGLSLRAIPLSISHPAPWLAFLEK